MKYFYDVKYWCIEICLLDLVDYEYIHCNP